MNADVGERDRPDGADDELLGWVTTAHVACGGHAGSAAVMAEVAQTCRRLGVTVGAHPSYPDRDGFGRRPMRLASAELTDTVADQVGTLLDLAARHGTPVRSVKAHGALYHAMAHDPQVADAVATAVLAVGLLVVVLPAGAPTAGLVEKRGLPVVAEGFCDRAYLPDGRLVPRDAPGAVLTDPARAAAQALSLARDRRVQAVDGSWLSLDVATLCVHSDTPGAVAVARAVRRACEEAQVPVAPFVR